MNDAKSLDPQELARQFTPKEVKVLKPDRQLCTVRFSPCGKLLAAGDQEGRLRLWDAARDDLPELAPVTGLTGWVQCLAFDPRGKRLYAADSSGQLAAWDYQEGELATAWKAADAHAGWIRGVDISPDGQWLASAGIDRRACIFAAADGKRRYELLGHGEPVLAVSFHPDGKSAVSGDLKGVVKQWDVETGKPLREFDARSLHVLNRLQDVGGVRSLTFDTQGETLFVAGLTPKSGGNVQGTPTVLAFDWESGKLRHTLQAGRDGDGFVYDQHFHPAGFLIAVSSGNPGSGMLLLHRPGDDRPFFTTNKMANCHSLAVHPGGQRLVVGATNTGSNGNGRRLNKDGQYEGNTSPLYVLDLPLA